MTATCQPARRDRRDVPCRCTVGAGPRRRSSRVNRPAKTDSQRLAGTRSPRRETGHVGSQSIAVHRGLVPRAGRRPPSEPARRSSRRGGRDLFDSGRDAGLDSQSSERAGARQATADADDRGEFRFGEHRTDPGSGGTFGEEPHRLARPSPARWSSYGRPGWHGRDVCAADEFSSSAGGDDPRHGAACQDGGQDGRVSMLGRFVVNERETGRARAAIWVRRGRHVVAQPRASVGRAEDLTRCAPRPARGQAPCANPRESGRRPQRQPRLPTQPDQADQPRGSPAAPEAPAKQQRRPMNYWPLRKVSAVARGHGHATSKPPVRRGSTPPSQRCRRRYCMRFPRYPGRPSS